MAVIAIRQGETLDDTSKIHADPEGFDAFWTIYPRKNAKLDARRAWSSIDPNLWVDIIVACASWRRVWMKRGDMQYVPLPASWLRGERWEDELPNDGRSGGPASHVAFTKTVAEPKGEMPEHIRLLLRKLTGRV